MREIIKSRAVLVLLSAIFVILGLSGFGRAQAATEPDDEIHSSFGDTASQMWVYWHGPDAAIQYGLTGYYNHSATAQAPTATPVDITGPFWQVKLTGLTPGTTYHYQIGNSGLDHTFQTAPTGDMVWDDIGDTGTSYYDPSAAPACNKTWMPQVWQQLAAEQPNFVTHGGDISYANECGQPAVHQFWNDIAPVATQAAIQFAWGNHEYGGPIDTSPPNTPRDTMANYKGRYNMANAQTVPNDSSKQVANPGCPSPTNPKVNGCLGNDWGSFVAGHVLFISYPEPWPNAYQDWQTKAGVLMAQAETNPNIYFIVTYGHRPAESSQVSNAVNTDLLAAVNALGDQYSPTARADGKYVLNLSHHVHAGEIFSPLHGVVNATDGGGGSEEAGIQKGTTGSLWFTNHLSHLHTVVTGNQMTLNFICGPVFTPNPTKNACTQGSVLFSKTLTGYRAQLNSVLTASLSDGVTNANVGDQVTYTASATNSVAGSTASGTVMTVTLPANESIVDAGGGTVNGTTITWPAADLAGGATTSKQVIAHIDSGNPGDSLTATVNLQTSGTDCQNGGSVCSASDTDTIPVPLLNTTLTDTGGTAQVGDVLHYTATAQNTQAGTNAQGVTLSLTLPANLSITDAGTGTVNGNTVTWPAADLSGGQNIVGTVTATVISGAQGSSFTAVASLQTLDTSCQNSGSVCSASDTNSIPLPQLITSVTDGVSTATTGDILHYTVNAQNTQVGSTAAGATVGLTLPANLSIVDAGTGTVNGNTVTWPATDLATGQSIGGAVTAVVSSSVGGSNFAATAAVTTSDTSCQNAASVCSASDTDTVPVAKLTASLSDGVTSAKAGDTLHYAVGVQNGQTDSTATGVSFSLTLPANLTITDPAGGVVTGNTITWQSPDLASGQTVGLTVTATVASAVPGSNFSATATVQTGDTSCQNAASVCSASDTDTVPQTAKQWITNQSIETNLTGWGSYNTDTTFTRITTDAYDGTASMQMVRKDATAGTAGVISKPDAVTATTAGTTYDGTVWVRSQTAGQSIVLMLKEFDSAGNTIGSKSVTVTSSNTSWHQLETTYTAKNSGDTVRFIIYATNLTATGWFHIDLMSLLSPN